jgi:hypothetical protein
MMEQYGMIEREVKERAVEMCGSLELAMQAMEKGQARTKAAIEQAFSHGIQNATIQVGVSEVAFL